MFSDSADLYDAIYGAFKDYASESAAVDSPIAVLGAPGSIAMGEVNGDGKPDIVTSNLESNGVTVLLAQ
jgi:FG-GAP repeat